MAEPPAADAFPSDALFREIIESSPYLYVVIDQQVRFTYANPAVESILGYLPEELIGMSATDVIYPDDFELAIGALAQLVDEFDAHPDEGIPMALRLICKDGSLTYVETGAIPRFDDPAVRGVIVRGRPMSGQQHLDQALEALVASSPLDDVLEFLVTSVEHELRGASTAIGYGWDGSTFESVVAHDVPAELCGAPLPDGAPAPDLDTPWAMGIAAQALTQYPDLASLPPRTRAAAERAGFNSCWIMPVAIPPDNAQLACIIVWRQAEGPAFVSHTVALDRAARLTSLAFERRHTEELLRHAALHDNLTGIANRSQFFLRLDEETVDHVDDELVAVLYLDLDGFKPVNDRYGHAAGDELLRRITDRITANVRPQDLVARLGGDEFSVLCSSLTNADEATAIADRLIHAVREPVELGGAEVSVGVSIGVALAPPGHASGAELLDAADAALYDVKRSGKGGWRLARLDTRIDLTDTST